ncbi:hypothetical protein ANN_10027 [Periplaneta americana]|uniref:Uncharacterized protein n=1 Tax=Periplaneta americana TaxID=6978 RepID=A0ABQ8TN84_PERAM|nr:hypothetical protein ANN_10027 [Periplaneta americana]
MKSLWRKMVKEHLKSFGYKPTRKDFMPLFSSVFQETVTISNIASGFRKTGIYPLDRGAIPDTTFMPSLLPMSKRRLKQQIFHQFPRPYRCAREAQLLKTTRKE